MRSVIACRGFLASLLREPEDRLSANARVGVGSREPQEHVEGAGFAALRDAEHRALLHLGARILLEHAPERRQSPRASRVAEPEGHLLPQRFRLTGGDQPLERRVGCRITVQRDG